MPFVDAAHHGEVVILAMVWAGDPGRADEALRRSVGDAAGRPGPPGRTPRSPTGRPGHPTAIARNLFVNRIGLEEAARIVKHLAASDASIRVAQIRVLGGAAARVPVDATAYAHRKSPIMVNVASFYEGEADRPVRQAWVEGLVRDLLQEDTGVYVNFLVDEGEARIRAAYPGATWDRLVAIKRRYDPDNVFRRNQNVPPAAA
jgi:hypothetical protein